MSEPTTGTQEPDERQLWMVITLKTSGARLHTRVDEYTVKRHPITDDLVGLKWSTHEDSPTKLMEIDLGQIAMVHTEYAPPTA